MSAPRVFDQAHYDSLNASRAVVVGDLLAQLKGQFKLSTAIDVGCGMGFFSAYLHSLGYQVTAIDGRQGNAQEAGRRVPQVKFYTLNAEDPALCELGRFDLVLCFGLLYHLENPFLAIRHLHTLTEQLLLVESVIFPGSEPVMALINEGPNEDQGLNHLAFYPTEGCLVKLLYQSGFPRVYRFSEMPAHGDFQIRPRTRQVRTMLAASRQPLQTTALKLVVEPHMEIKPWDPYSGAKEETLLSKLRRFAQKPFPEKMKSLRHRFSVD